MSGKCDVKGGVYAFHWKVRVLRGIGRTSRCGMGKLG